MYASIIVGAHPPITVGAHPPITVGAHPPITVGAHPPPQLNACYNFFSVHQAEKYAIRAIGPGNSADRLDKYGSYLGDARMAQGKSATETLNPYPFCYTFPLSG